jgi:hypothetical protein
MNPSYKIKQNTSDCSEVEVPITLEVRTAVVLRVSNWRTERVTYLHVSVHLGCQSGHNTREDYLSWHDNISVHFAVFRKVTSCDLVPIYQTRGSHIQEDGNNFTRSHHHGYLIRRTLCFNLNIYGIWLGHHFWKAGLLNKGTENCRSTSRYGPFYGIVWLLRVTDHNLNV